MQVLQMEDAIRIDLIFTISIVCIAGYAGIYIRCIVVVIISWAFVFLWRNTPNS